MKHAITLGQPHGKQGLVIITGPEVSVGVQRTQLKEFLASKENADFQRIEIWDSASGRVKSARFVSPTSTAAANKRAVKNKLAAAKNTAKAASTKETNNDSTQNAAGSPSPAAPPRASSPAAGKAAGGDGGGGAGDNDAGPRIPVAPRVRK